VDKSYHGRETQCISNNIITIEAILGTSKESVKQPDYLVAKFKYNAVKKTTIYLSPRRNFKTTGRWHKKSGRTEQSGYQFKNTNLACKQYP
jgi:hypothetical protein